MDKLGAHISKVDQVFPRRPDAHDTEDLTRFFIQAVSQGIFRLKFPFPPQVGGIANFYFIVKNVEINGVLGSSTDEDAGVILGFNQFFPEIARSSASAVARPMPREPPVTIAT